MRTAVTRALVPLVLVGAVAVACTQPQGVEPGGSPAPVASPAAPTGWVAAMLASVNTQRAANGAAAVSLCGTLANAAQAHSEDQAARRTMSHVGGDGSTLAQRANRAGYLGWTALGENVAAGYPDVASVMAGWMGSAGHRANLLNTKFTHAGFGYAVGSNGTPYWTQVFGRSGTC